MHPCGTKSHPNITEQESFIEIKAVKFRKDGFYSQPFAFGGEEGPEKFDKNIRYRGSLQNYLIDTGDGVILVDTGLPAGMPKEKPDENSPAYTGKDICSCMEAFAALGYKCRTDASGPCPDDFFIAAVSFCSFDPRKNRAPRTREEKNAFRRGISAFFSIPGCRIS